MKTKPMIRSMVALAAFGWTGAALPLSLGPVSGATVVGRALTLSAPIQFDEGTPGDCVSAELLYGDRAVDGSRVRVKLTHDAARQVSIATISSPAIVDEPVVTVLLHVGCARPSTRRYVLLAEAPKDEAVSLTASSSLARADVEPTRRPPVAPLSQPVAATPRLTAPSARVQARAPQGRGAAAAVAGTVVTGRARLQLGLWDPGPEGSPWLRTSTELKSMPLASAAQRAAATALWRALNANPQDLLRTAERLRGLEGEVTSLRGLAARHRSDISAARESLQAARNEQLTNLALTLLLALLAGASAAFFWHRSWRAAAAAPVARWNQVAPPGDAVVGQQRESAVAAQPPVPVAFAPQEFTAPQARTPPPAAAPQGHDSRRLKVEALNDAQQQAEFFASLGQSDEAVAVLTRYLGDCSEKPVLVFLELLRICHDLNMRAEYEEWQAQFRQTFGMDAMSFGTYKEDRRELELFPAAITRIAASWPSQSSLEVVEGLLFKPPVTARDLLSLEAYRELIWLHTLGQEIVHSTGLPAGLKMLGDTGLPNDHFILPWALGAEDGPPELSLDQLNRMDVASELTGFGVDIDLSSAPSDAPRDAAQSLAAATSSSVRAHGSERAAPVTSFDDVMESQSRNRRR